LFQLPSHNLGLQANQASGFERSSRNGEVGKAAEIGGREKATTKTSGSDISWSALLANLNEKLFFESSRPNR